MTKQQRMKAELKDILVRIFDYNRNGKVDWYEFVLGSLFMLIYWGIIIGIIIFMGLLMG